MKQYDVKISHAALSDMEQIYSYIADRLLEPDTAMGQYNRIAEAIQSLNILPERCVRSSYLTARSWNTRSGRMRTERW